jgi:hypothetical protein
MDKSILFFWDAGPEVSRDGRDERKALKERLMEHTQRRVRRTVMSAKREVEEKEEPLGGGAAGGISSTLYGEIGKSGGPGGRGRKRVARAVWAPA